MTAPSYCTVAQFAKFGLPTAQTSRLPDHDAKIAAAIEARSSQANASLAKQFKLPLQSWGEDLSLAVAQTAAWDVLTLHVGISPESPDGAVWQSRRDEGLLWLRSVAKGEITPSDVVDSTEPPEAAAPRAAFFLVDSDHQRTW